MPGSTNHVLTLISNPARPVLARPVIERTMALIPLRPPAVWLADGIAADFAFGATPEIARETAARVRRALAEAPIDVVLQPQAQRRKRLLVADMDSTMIGQECIDELADAVGLRDRVAAITERAMRGEIAFEPALRERVALLAGLPVSIIGELLASRITLTPGARALVATMKAAGAFTLLVSGGFSLFTGPVAARIGFDAEQANRLVLDGDRLAGTVAEPILGRAAKLEALISERTRRGLNAEETLAVGDGANDLAMLGAAGLGVAYHAKPVVAEAAAARIDHGDLTALLYLQGFRREDFVLSAV